MTPGAPSPGGYNPHTPGSNIDQTSSDWVTTDILVRVKDTFLDGGVINQTGVIRSVTVSGAFFFFFLIKRTFVFQDLDYEVYSPYVMPHMCRP